MVAMIFPKKQRREGNERQMKFRHPHPSIITINFVVLRTIHSSFPTNTYRQSLYKSDLCIIDCIIVRRMEVELGHQPLAR